MNSQILKLDFHITSELSLNVCKFVNVILLIRGIKSITSDVLDSLVLAKLYSVDNRCFSNSLINRCFSGFAIKSPSKYLKQDQTVRFLALKQIETWQYQPVSGQWLKIFAFVFSLDGLNLVDSLDFDSNDGNETFLTTSDNSFVLSTNLSLRNSI